MQQSLPIRYAEAFKLSTLGLNPDLFKLGVLSFESEKYISVKDGAVIRCCKTRLTRLFLFFPRRKL